MLLVQLSQLCRVDLGLRAAKALPDGCFGSLTRGVWLKDRDVLDRVLVKVTALDELSAHRRVEGDGRGRVGFEREEDVASRDE